MCVLCEQRKRPQQWRWWWWNGIKWLRPGSSPIWRIRALYSRMHAPEQQHTIFLFLRPAVWLHFILHIRLNIPFGRDGVAYGKPRRSATSLLFSVRLAFRSFDRSTADEHRYSRYSVTTFPSSIAPWSMIIVIHSYKSFFITSNLEGGTSTLYRLIPNWTTIYFFSFFFLFSSIYFVGNHNTPSTTDKPQPLIKQKCIVWHKRSIRHWNPSRLSACVVLFFQHIFPFMPFGRPAGSNVARRHFLYTKHGSHTFNILATEHLSRMLINWLSAPRPRQL